MAKAMSHSKWQMNGRSFPCNLSMVLIIICRANTIKKCIFWWFMRGCEPSPRALWCNGENPTSVGIIQACQLAVIHQILTISIGAALCLSTIFCRSRMASSPTPGLCLLLQLGTNDWKHEHVIKNTAWWLSSVICSCHSPWDYHGVLNTFLQGWRPWKGPGLRGICEKKNAAVGMGTWWQVVNLHFMVNKITNSKPSVLWCLGMPKPSWWCLEWRWCCDAPRCYKKELGFSTHKKKRMKQASCFWKHWIYDVCKTSAIPALSCIAMSG